MFETILIQFLRFIALVWGKSVYRGLRKGLRGSPKNGNR